MTAPVRSAAELRAFAIATVERCLEHGFALAFSRDREEGYNVGTAGWNVVPPLAEQYAASLNGSRRSGIEHIAGLIAPRLERRNPMLVSGTSGLVSFDIDGGRALALLEMWGLPETFRTATGKPSGFHDHYRAPAGWGGASAFLVEPVLDRESGEPTARVRVAPKRSQLFCLPGAWHGKRQVAYAVARDVPLAGLSAELLAPVLERAGSRESLGAPARVDHGADLERRPRLRAVVEALGARPNPRGWEAPCPAHAHPGQSPTSLLIFPGDHTEVGLYCAAGCDPREIRATEELAGIFSSGAGAAPASGARGGGGGTSAPKPEAPPGFIVWGRLSEIEMRSIRFLDKPLLQADAFHLLVGRKGVGKGTVLAGFASRVTRGELGAKRSVIWIGSEDSAAIDIKPRIVAAGGAPERVVVVRRGWVQLPRDVGELERALEELGDVGLLAIDPVGNHIAGMNSNSETDIRDAIAHLNRLADERECMVFGVRHLTEKEARLGVLSAVLGSSAWVQLPRAVLAVVRDDEDPQTSHIQCVIGNRLPPSSSGRVFRIEGALLPGLENEVTRAVWLGDSAKDVETMLAKSERPSSKSADARELILDILEREGEQESDALDARVARETGLAAKTVKNQRVALKDAGLVKALPEKDETGAVERWLVVRTQAPR